MTIETFKQVFDDRWSVEQTILTMQAMTLTDLRSQIEILAARSHDGADVADDLERLATELTA
jgi:hypothetical protein